MDFVSIFQPAYAFALKYSLLEWIYFFVITFATYYLIRICHSALSKRLNTKGYNFAFDIWKSLFVSTTRLFLLGAALYFSTRFVDLSAQIEVLIQKISMIIFWIQVAIWLSTGIKHAADRYIERKRALDQSAVTAASMSFFGARVLVFILVLLLALDNIGFDVTTLIASLGIGGIAIALAVQNILGDLLASLSITLDKPFVVGDFIVMDEFMGTVENIGLKTTRIRSLNGEQIIFSNAELLKGRIRNYKRMFERRAVFTFTLRHDTSIDALSKIPLKVRDSIEKIPKTRFDRCHFVNISDLGFVFEAVYLVLAPDYNQYMDIQQSINIELLKNVADLDTNFAFSPQLIGKECIAAPQ